MMLKIDYDLVEETYGERFRSVLEYLDITFILDVNEFIERNHFYPCISSIWKYSSGSYIFEDEELGSVCIQNGNLLAVEDYDIPFGEEYYNAYIFKTPKSTFDGILVINKLQAQEYIRNGYIKTVDPSIQKWTTKNLYIYTLIDNNGNKYYFRGSEKDFVF